MFERLAQQGIVFEAEHDRFEQEQTAPVRRRHGGEGRITAARFRPKTLQEFHFA